jgi:hypothetical protein
MTLGNAISRLFSTRRRNQLANPVRALSSFFTKSKYSTVYLKSKYSLFAAEFQLGLSDVWKKASSLLHPFAKSLALETKTLCWYAGK